MCSFMVLVLAKTRKNGQVPHYNVPSEADGVKLTSKYATAQELIPQSTSIILSSV